MPAYGASTFRQTGVPTAVTCPVGQIVDAVTEMLALKQKLFRELCDRLCRCRDLNSMRTE